MPATRLDHFRHHGRFYVSVLCGIAVWLLPIPPVDDLALAVNVVTRG